MNSILEGNEKLVFVLEKINIKERFGSEVDRKFRNMMNRDWIYLGKPNVKYKLQSRDKVIPFNLTIVDESATFNLKYHPITEDSEYGDLILTFTTRSMNEEKYKNIPLENKVEGICLVEKIINKVYDLFVRDTVADALVKEIEKLIS